MRQKIDYTVAIILIVLGVSHTALTPMFYKVFGLNALWFAGSGLPFIFLGVINIIRIKTAEKFIKILCSISNAIALLFCALIVLKMAQPQAFISLFAMIILLGLSLIDLRPNRNSQ